MYLRKSLILYLLCPAVFASNDYKPELEQIVNEGITIDLRKPAYTDGVLSTDQGGVVQSAHIRVQAQHIRYIRLSEEGEPCAVVFAEGDLIVEYRDYIFVGDALHYDFHEKKGVLFNACSALDPWSFGGQRIELHEDEAIHITNGYLTTSQCTPPEWQICTDSAVLIDQHLLSAENVKVQILKIPVFWTPILNVDLDYIFDSPIRYNLRWGGKQGLRLGMLYEVFSWNYWKTFLRVDFRPTKGVGAGIETEFETPDAKTSFYTKNYYANAVYSFVTNDFTDEYRFQGLFHTGFWEDKYILDFSYDKLSDRDMATYYADAGLDLRTGERTQVNLHRRGDYWMANLYARWRINNYQTVKQQQPTFYLQFKPYALWNAGVVTENSFKIGYLDYKYSRELDDRIPDYNSTRLEINHKLFYQVALGPLSITPQFGAVAILYGNSPTRNPQTLILLKAECEANTFVYKNCVSWKHILKPYLRYERYFNPTITPSQHYIFDMSDGLTSQNLLRFGLLNTVYNLWLTDYLAPALEVDFYTNAFFSTPTIPTLLPKVYLDLTSHTLPTLKHSFQAAWDFENNQLDHFNFQMGWTFGPDYALAWEYRHRSAYSWRKANVANFLLESYHTNEELRHSSLSDKRDTLLVHFFYRFLPNWSCELASRFGWQRKFQPNYVEYEFDILTTVRSTWNLRWSIQHRENDTRSAFYVSLGVRPPGNPTQAPAFIGERYE